MIIPSLKDIHILYDEWGEEPDDFYVCLEAYIGEEDKEGSEVFRFHIISPKRMVKHSKDTLEIEVGRGYLIASDYSLPRIKSKIKQLLTNCKRKNWDETISAISRYGIWENES
ncbi:Imm8 family immunity protein [Pseudalkalibacillus salsuginis]|uniref:Imm8 family immunity protein n=1 Tax=Pseudalkalibacillus salsuginis TaxID=2910972 RepID=UPI001F23FD0B|nr:Imm8 family immunity protein [Pseudalkalibacillus salsuginis]MCF6410408.1 immunity 8 family protein [Pseudalkalibacillus salsuginis]